MFVKPQSPRESGERRFREWYSEHFEYVYRTLRRLGTAGADPGDLTHDVFVVAWKQRAQVDPDRAIRPWLFGVAYRVAAAERRKAWFRRTQSEPELHVEDPSMGPEKTALLRSELKKLDDALRRMPLRHRAVLLLHDFDEVSMKEVAEALGIPLKTGYSRLDAARRSLRQALARAELEEVPLQQPHAALGPRR